MAFTPKFPADFDLKSVTLTTLATSQTQHRQQNQAEEGTHQEHNLDDELVEAWGCNAEMSLGSKRRVPDEDWHQPKKRWKRADSTKADLSTKHTRVQRALRSKSKEYGAKASAKAYFLAKDKVKERARRKERPRYSVCLEDPAPKRLKPREWYPWPSVPKGKVDYSSWYEDDDQPGVSSWVRDLTEDGDVEKQPGPPKRVVKVKYKGKEKTYCETCMNFLPADHQCKASDLYHAYRQAEASSEDEKAVSSGPPPKPKRDKGKGAASDVEVLGEPREITPLHDGLDSPSVTGAQSPKPKQKPPPKTVEQRMLDAGSDDEDEVKKKELPLRGHRLDREGQIVMMQELCVPVPESVKDRLLLRQYRDDERLAANRSVNELKKGFHVVEVQCTTAPYWTRYIPFLASLLLAIRCHRQDFTVKLMYMYYLRVFGWLWFTTYWFGMFTLANLAYYTPLILMLPWGTIFDFLATSPMLWSSKKAYYVPHLLSSYAVEGSTTSISEVRKQAQARINRLAMFPLPDRQAAIYTEGTVAACTAYCKLQNFLLPANAQFDEQLTDCDDFGSMLAVDQGTSECSMSQSDSSGSHTGIEATKLEPSHSQNLSPGAKSQELLREERDLRTFAAFLKDTCRDLRQSPLTEKTHTRLQSAFESVSSLKCPSLSTQSLRNSANSVRRWLNLFHRLNMYWTSKSGSPAPTTTKKERSSSVKRMPGATVNRLYRRVKGWSRSSSSSLTSSIKLPEPSTHEPIASKCWRDHYARRSKTRSIHVPGTHSDDGFSRSTCRHKKEWSECEKCNRKSAALSDTEHTPLIMSPSSNPSLPESLEQWSNRYLLECLTRASDGELSDSSRQYAASTRSRRARDAGYASEDEE